MNSDELRGLEASLWEAADQLRANSRLNASEYSMPVLGLIFLRHANNRFDVVKAEVEKTLPSRGGKTRPLTKDDFKGRAAVFLPDKARYDYLADLPSGEDLGAAINQAMRLVEAEDPDQLAGVLPKEYHRFDKKLLEDVVRIFNREALRSASGDVFGRIYEYFLNKFASSVAQDEGQFFTPPSLVRLIVNVIEPNHGRVFDPAVGSAGMLVQSAHFMTALEKNPGEAATFIGRDKSETTVKLAKMNVVVHGFNADIQEGNSYYDRHESLIGQCDFVMANPPFNVDGVDPARVKDDPRLWTAKKIPGVTKAKKDKKGGQKPPGVSNANYLWIQYFRAYLNVTGRAGFVMAASATDAGHGEQDIRREIVETGDVDVIIRIGEKFFYTRTLPCTLWFFDRAKPAERKDQVLMIDARNIFRIVNRRVRDFSDEQLQNLTAIVWLYRGQADRYLRLVRRYLEDTAKASEALPDALKALDAPLSTLTQIMADWRQAKAGATAADPEAAETLSSVLEERTGALGELGAGVKSDTAALASWRKWLADTAGALDSNSTQKDAFARVAPVLPRLRALQKHVNEVHKLTMRAVDLAEKQLDAKSDGAWDSREVRAQRNILDDARRDAIDAIRRVLYLAGQVHWLQERFPEAAFASVSGLCRVVERKDISEQDWSLTPGRYVGVAPPEVDEDEDIEERMREIHVELQGLHEEAAEFLQLIAANFEGLFG